MQSRSISEKPLDPVAIRKLAFSGGAMLILGELGALEAAVEAGLALETITHVAGASAGALMGLLVVLGYSIEEMHVIMMEDFDCGQMIAHPAPLAFFSTSGLYRTDYLRQFIHARIAEKFGGDNVYMSFSRLAEVTGRSLYVTVSKSFLDTSQTASMGCVVFSPDSFGDTPIADAVLASASVPFLFQSVRMVESGPNCWKMSEWKTEGRFGLFSDGGITNNFPDNLLEGIDPPGTLGFLLIPREAASALEDVRRIMEAPAVTDFFSILMANARSIMGTRLQLAHRNISESHVVCIDVYGLNPFNFRMAAQEKKTILQRGRDGFAAFLAENAEKAVPALLPVSPMTQRMRPGFFDSLTEISLTDMDDAVQPQENEQKNASVCSIL